MNDSTDNTLAIVKARNKVVWCVIAYLFIMGEAMGNSDLNLYMLIPYLMQLRYTYNLAKVMNYKFPFIYSIGAMIPVLNVLLPAFLAEHVRAKLHISALL